MLQTVAPELIHTQYAVFRTTSDPDGVFVSMTANDGEVTGSANF
jgi:hypothetical protein